MSDNISVDEIRRKIHDGLYETCQRDVKKTIYGTVSMVSERPSLLKQLMGQMNVRDATFRMCSAKKCAKLLTYDKAKGGTSHL